MAQIVINIQGNVLARWSIRKLTIEELKSELEKRDKFDEAILSRLGSLLNLPETQIPPPEDDYIDGGMIEESNNGDLDKLIP